MPFVNSADKPDDLLSIESFDNPSLLLILVHLPNHRGADAA